MPTNLDSMLGESLHRQAEAGTPVDPALLLDSARSQGQRLRRGRRLAVTGGAFVATVAIATGVATLPGGSDRAAPAPGTALPSTVASEPAGGVVRMPAAGQPGALARPDLVGTDPAVLHFSVDDMIGAAKSVKWTSARDLESVEIDRTDSASALVVVARRKEDFGQARSSDAESVVVQGRSGTLATLQGEAGNFILTWSPGAGFWAELMVYGTTREEAVRTAEAVRFDRSTSCVVPLRLTAMPAGMAVQQCSVTLNADGFEGAGLWVGDQHRYAWFDAAPKGSPKFKPTLTVGPHRVLNAQDTWLFTDGPYLLTLNTAVGGGGPISQSAARTLVAGSRTVGEPDDPATW